MQYIENAFADSIRGVRAGTDVGVHDPERRRPFDRAAGKARDEYLLPVRPLRPQARAFRGRPSARATRIAASRSSRSTRRASSGPILHREVLTPVDLEREFHLTGGNISHGRMTLDQMFSMRPVPGYADYRTPVQGLYMCGSGTHPGGGVMGLPGRNAARVMLKDIRRL